MQNLEFEVENLRFSPFLLKFLVLVSFPCSAYLCTPLARQPTISALNPFALRNCRIKNSLNLQFSLHISSFSLDLLEFLMRQRSRLTYCTFYFIQSTRESQGGKSKINVKARHIELFVRFS